MSCGKHDNIQDNLVLELKEVSFKAHDNSPYLLEDIKCEIIGDTLVECWIPNILESKLLKPSIVYDADFCTIDSLVFREGESMIDFRKPAKLILYNKETTKEYIMLIHSFTGLPVVRITTKDYAPIVSKEDYLEAKISIEEDIIYKESSGIKETPVLIKGRGHSTWFWYPKKPYRLKFDEKVALLDMPKDKAWVLIANYKDNTLLRNHIAYWLGSISNLDYTPRFQFVECVLNGNYIGNYQLGEKLKISKNRVSVGDDGFLLEMASNEDRTEPYFTTNQIVIPFYFKDPEVEMEDDNYCYVRDLFINAENSLYSDSFQDPIEGWRRYLDEDSFVDYYLINEIGKCIDAVRWTSTYFNFRKGGKIKIGPLWDFDSAFGNEIADDCDNPNGFYTNRYGWYPRLFEDPAFVASVKERFDYFYSMKSSLLLEIDKYVEVLSRSVKENNTVWGTLDTGVTSSQPFQGGGYEKEIEWMKDWICRRLEWLKSEYENM